MAWRRIASADPIQWRIYVALGGDELMSFAVYEGIPQSFGGTEIV